MNRKIKAAILGFGGMGHAHASQYAAQTEVELVALCDIDQAQLDKDEVVNNIGGSGRTDHAKLRKYRSYGALIRGEKELDYIDICLPSDLHAKYAVRAMRDGLHVLCEKPMALNLRDANRMIQVSRETGKTLMIAQCLRFAEEFEVIREAYVSGRYGRLLRMDMRRNGYLPASKWFRDVKRSGGALLDLHLHDADFLNSLLGLPGKIMCRGVVVSSGGIDDSMTEYFYPAGPIVNSEGSWARGEFKASVAAVFEHGTIEIDTGKPYLCRPDCKREELPMPGKGSPYFNEIAYFAHCVKNHLPVERATPESTRDSIGLVLLERKSAFAGGRPASVKKF